MKTHFYMKLLLIFALFLKATSVFPASLEEICSEYRQDLEEIIKPETSHHKEQHDEFSTGLLWKIGTDTGKSNYLFGTIHSQDRAVTQFPPGVRLALAQSHSLIIESILNEESSKIFLDSIFFPEQEDQKLSDLIEAPIYQYLEESLPDYGVPLEKLPKLKPWAAFTLMGRPKPVNAATLDMVLIQTARSLNKPIISLETMEELLEPMENLSINDQITILNDTVCNHKQIIRNSWELVQLYLARDLAGMMAFSDQPHFDEGVFNRYIQGILYKRNERMLERIIPYLNDGSAFIAVGALHLAGENGLLRVLKNKNYHVTRVY
ncbi:MAG: TraB/GumN family protein [Proteobacteria bacterium]|nr:TraB/GumN family protein [Pseudomonadota bacterium]